MAVCQRSSRPSAIEGWRHVVKAPFLGAQPNSGQCTDHTVDYCADAAAKSALKVEPTAAIRDGAIEVSSARDSSRFSRRLVVERFWLPMISVLLSVSNIFLVHVQSRLGGRQQVHGAAGGRHFGHGIGQRRVLGEHDAAVDTAARGLVQGAKHRAILEYLGGDIDTASGLVDALQEAGTGCR